MNAIMNLQPYIRASDALVKEHLNVYFEDDHYGFGVELVTGKSDISGLYERSKVCNTRVKEAKTVFDDSGDFQYIWCNFNTVCAGTQEQWIKIHSAIFNSDRQLLMLLSQNGMTCDKNMAVGKKADLFRIYILSKVNDRGELLGEGWKVEDQIKYRWWKDIPWWQRTGKAVVGKYPSVVQINKKDTFRPEKCDYLFSQKIIITLPSLYFLQPLFQQYRVKTEQVFNVILSGLQDVTIVRNQICKFFSWCEDNRIVELPMKPKMLSQWRDEHENCVLIAYIPTNVQGAKNVELLSENVQFLFRKYVENGGFPPIFLSDVPMMILQPEQMLSVEINGWTMMNTDMSSVLRQIIFKIVGNVEKYDSVLRELSSQKYASDFATVEKMINMVTELLKGIIADELLLTKEEISKYINEEIASCNADGVASMFVEKLRNLAEKGELKLISQYEEYTPQTIISTAEEIYLSREWFDEILCKKMCCGIKPLKVLAELEKEDIIVVEGGRRKSFETRRRCTCEGVARYKKFVVLKKDRIQRVGDIEVFETGRIL